MSGPFDDPALAALLAAAIEMRDEGVDPPLDAICAERPDLIEALREALETSQQLPFMRDLGTSRDRMLGKLLSLIHILTLPTILLV